MLILPWYECAGWPDDLVRSGEWGERSELVVRPRCFVLPPHSSLLTPHSFVGRGLEFTEPLSFGLWPGRRTPSASVVSPRPRLPAAWPARRRRSAPEGDGRCVRGNRGNPSAGHCRRRAASFKRRLSETTVIWPGDDSRTDRLDHVVGLLGQGEEDVDALDVLLPPRRQAGGLAASKTTVTQPGSSAWRASSRPSRARRAFSSPCGPTRPSSTPIACSRL